MKFQIGDRVKPSSRYGKYKPNTTSSLRGVIEIIEIDNITCRVRWDRIPNSLWDWPMKDLVLDFNGLEQIKRRHNL